MTPLPLVPSAQANLVVSLSRQYHNFQAFKSQSAKYSSPVCWIALASSFSLFSESALTIISNTCPADLVPFCAVVQV